MFAAALNARPLVKGGACRIHRSARASGSEGARLGMIVAKKLLRTSVRRNEAKRQIRESFRLVAARIPDGEYVVRVTGVDLSIPSKRWGMRLREELDRLWLGVAARP